MTKEEALSLEQTLRLALEYVELVPDDRYNAEHIDQDALITAIKAALEAKDEPVAWNEGVPAMLPKQKEGETFIVSYEPKQEAKDEPDKYAMDIECTKCGAKQSGVLTVHTTSPQRKPLTYEEIERLWPMRPTDDVINFARAIEAAHGIKGEA